MKGWRNSRTDINEDVLVGRGFRCRCGRDGGMKKKSLENDTHVFGVAEFGSSGGVAHF